MGYITGGRSGGNSAELGFIGYLAKGTTDCWWVGGLSIDMLNKGLYGKGDLNSVFANNTCVGITVSEVSSMMTTDADDLEVVDSLGATFYNNILYYALPFNVFSFSAVGSTANYINNMMFSSVTPPANQWSYAGVAYSTLAAWQAAVDATAETATGNTENDPLFINFASRDFRLSPGSPAVGAGVKFWANEGRPRTLQEPIPDTAIDLGGYHSTYDANHPANL